MEICNTIAATRERLEQWRKAGETWVLVPTMGNLHQGHIALMHSARAYGKRVVASVFVNPTQFGPGEDFEKYPRTLANDTQLLREAAVDLLFAPSVQDMYPHGLPVATRYEVGELGDILCGAYRPGHFNGVALVVSKLFNIVTPEVAVFGEKDYQQLAVIRQLVRDLNFPIQIVGAPTVRAEDGLALSSRNGYLSVSERTQAPVLYATLCALREQLLAGRRDYEALEHEALAQLAANGFKPDYISIRTPVSLAVPSAMQNAWVVLAAAYLGTTRLIDNLQIN